MSKRRYFDDVLQGQRQRREKVKVKLDQTHVSFVYNSKCRQHSLATEKVS